MLIISQMFPARKLNREAIMNIEKSFVKSEAGLVGIDSEHSPEVMIMKFLELQSLVMKFYHENKELRLQNEALKREVWFLKNQDGSKYPGDTHA
jgi:hypothetical protein